MVSTKRYVCDGKEQQRFVKLRCDKFEEFVNKN